MVILRPRAMNWDLLALRPADGHGSLIAFCDFGRDEAAALARQVQRSLEQAAREGVNLVEAMAGPMHGSYRVGARVSGFTWLACLRVPGQPYQPVDFATQHDAVEAATRLAKILCPPADADQEYYFNTQNFSR
jgi:hypothetical protein